MSTIKVMALAVVACGALAACGGGGSSEMSSGSPGATGNSPATPVVPTPAPSDPATADFTATVKGQLAATSDTAAPIETSEMKFAFKDDDNPAAFDDVLPPQTN